MSTTLTMTDVARHFGITRSQAFRELQSWPHTRVNGVTTFSADDFTAIQKMMNAGPDEQLARLMLIEQKREALRALDAA